MKLQLVGVRKLNGWILELKFVGQIIKKGSQLDCKKLFLNYLFIP